MSQNVNAMLRQCLKEVAFILAASGFCWGHGFSSAPKDGAEKNKQLLLLQKTWKSKLSNIC